MHAKRSVRAPIDPVLTQRLVLTAVGRDDVDDLTLLYSDPVVAYWTGPWTRAGVEAWAADMAARWTADGVGKWMARARSDESLVGRGGFTRFDLAGEIVLELGWAVRDARKGRGYATELGRAALDRAVTHHADLPIVAFTEVHNRAPRAVMERLGMRPAGIIRRDGLVEVHLWVVTPALRYPAEDASHPDGITHQEPDVGTQVPDPDHAERRPIAVEDSRC